MPYKDPEKKKEHQRQYRLKNKEKYREYNRQYSLKNKEKINERARKYRLTEKRKKYMKEYRLKNKEKIAEQIKIRRLKNKESVKKYMKEYNEQNREYLLGEKKKYYQKNKKKINFQNKKWYQDNKERAKQINKIYRKGKGKEILAEARRKLDRKNRREDPNYRMTKNLRLRVRHALKGLSKSAKTMELIGCTIPELWKHLEQCPSWEPWMTRENYGKMWHVDHIKPCASFNLLNSAQQYKCFRYTNLQPLEAIANIKKGKKIISGDITSPKM